MGSILSMIFCLKTNKGQGVLQKFSPEEKNWGRGPGLKFSVPARPGNISIPALEKVISCGSFHS
jgi:hypothetical protein